MMNNSTMLAGDKRIVPGSKEANMKTSHSLIISPNLDALLEYDDKIRELNSLISPTSPQLPFSAPIVGLPPPPRRTSRKTTSPTSLIAKSPLVQERCQWLECENPYVNPAPVFEFKDTLESGAHGSRSVPVRDVQKSSRPSQMSEERVEKVVGMSRSLFNDPDAKVECKTQLNDVLNTSPTQKSNLRERARAKGKLPKLAETVSLPGRRK